MPIIAPLKRANHGPHFRAFGLRGASALIDPFIGIDHAWMSAPTFPPHPHAGFSAVSYVFLDSETGIANRDSIGNHNLIAPGGVHWMAAGKGVVHEEVPAEHGKTVHSLQVFVNLPITQRDTPARALGLAPHEIPTVQQAGAKIRVVAGSFAGQHSPLDAPTAVTMLDVSLEPGAELILPAEAGQTVFLMPIFGTVSVDGQQFSLDDLKVPVYSSAFTPCEIRIQAPQGAAKVMVFGGLPMLPRTI